MSTIEGSFSANSLFRGRGITHRFISDKADGGDTSLIRPTGWNDEHVGQEITAKGAFFGLSDRVSANSTLGASSVHYARVMLTFAMTPTHIGLDIHTSSGNLDLGLYNDNGTGLAPGTKIASIGSTASPGTGTQKFAITTGNLQPGVYWVACVADNGTISAQYSGTGTGNGGGGPHRFLRQASTFPLPTTAGSVTGNNWAAAVWLEAN